MNPTPASSSEPDAAPATPGIDSPGPGSAPLGQERAVSQVVVDLAISAVGIGVFDADLTTGVLRWDRRLAEMYGITDQADDRTWPAFTDRMHPEDRTRVIAARDEAVATGGSYALDYRVVHPGGEVRWLTARGRAIRDETGVSVRLLGAAFDSTSLRDESTRSAHILDSMPVGYVSLDADGRVTHLNSEAERMLGARGALLGGVIWDLFPATVGSDFEAGYRAAAAGRPVSFEAYYPAPLNSWFEVRAIPEGDGVALYFTDISVRHASEHAQVVAAHQLAALAQAALALALATTVEDLVVIVAEEGLSALGADGGAVAIADPADPAVLLSYITSSFGEGTRAAYARLPLDTALPVCAAARTDHRVLLADEASSLVFSPLMAEVNRSTGCQAWASLPLRAGAKVLGVLTAGWTQPQSFERDQVALLEAFAAQCAQALQRLQALEAERGAADQVRSMAEALQRSLLTALPEPDHLQLTARYAPTATGAQIGGDWYDAFLVPDGATTLVIGDVTGHDRDAAVAMAGVRNVLRGIAHAIPHPPAAILSALDQAMGDLSITALTTGILAKIEQSTADAALGLRQLRWSNAGHPPPLLLHPDGRAELLETPSDLLLGLDPATTRHDHTRALVPGASVLFYTDGLVERRGESLQVGLERLRATAQRLAGASPAPTLDAWCDALLSELAPHADDDVALLAVRTHPEDQPRPPEAGPVVLPDDLSRRQE